MKGYPMERTLEMAIYTCNYEAVFGNSDRLSLCYLAATHC